MPIRSSATKHAVALAGTIAAWWLLMTYADPETSQLGAALVQSARSIAAGLFLVSGIARLVSWGLRRDGHTAITGLALVAGGAMLPVAAVVGAGVGEGQMASLEYPSARLVFVLPVLALLGCGLLIMKRSSLRSVLRAVAAWIVCAFALMVLAAVASGSSWVQLPVWTIVESAVAAAWLGYAVSYRRLGGDLPELTHRLLTRASLAAGLMACSDGVLAFGAAAPGRLDGVATGFELAAAAVSAAASMACLRTVLAEQRSRSLDLAHALGETRGRLAGLEHRERVRLHDARSAVVGVLGASQLLAEPAAREHLDTTRVGQLMCAELERLRTVLEFDGREDVRNFRLADALEPVVAAHRLAGTTITTELDDVVVTGRPRAVATVVDNLLRNAALHAPGAQVWIRAAKPDARAVLVVEDDGPGIPANARAAVLRAGVRANSAAPGSGLGLHSAASIAAAQGGTLELLARPAGGTRVVVTLPAAAARAEASMAMSA